MYYNSVLRLFLEVSIMACAVERDVVFGVEEYKRMLQELRQEEYSRRAQKAWETKRRKKHMQELSQHAQEFWDSRN